MFRYPVHLEDLALQYYLLPEIAIRFIIYAASILGGIFAGLTNTSREEMARAPFFAWFTLILFLEILLQTAWLWTNEAFENEVMWTLLLLDVASFSIAGFFFCRIAIKRSQHAWGNPHNAFLVLVPILCLWLFFKPGRAVLADDGVSVSKNPSIFGGNSGIIAGIAFIILMVIVSLATAFVVKRALEENAAVQTESSVDTSELETTLACIAAEEGPFPIWIDEFTTLENVEAAGTELRRTYGFNVLTSMPDGVAQATEIGICDDASAVSLLEAGATIRAIFLGMMGEVIGDHTVWNSTCVARRAATGPTPGDVREYINQIGIEAYLQWQAESTLLPMQVNDVTTMVAIAAVGSQLQRTYVLASADTPIGEELYFQAVLCNEPYYRAILDAGGSYR
jgi:hypothetical protein